MVSRDARRRIAGVLVSMVVAVVGVLVASPSSAQAASTLRAYIVDAKTPALTPAAQSAIVKAGGTVVQTWPQIGVVIAQSTNSTFLSRLKVTGAGSVIAAADSRGTAVTDGSSAGASVSVTARPSSVGTTVASNGTTDPLTSRQYYLRSIGALTANKITEGSTRVLVGVLDTGVDGSHPDLAANFDAADSVNCTRNGRPDTAYGHWTGSDGHGTHVAGIIASAHNRVGILGVAPHVRLASVKVVDNYGTTYPEYVICGIMWSALKHFTVTNNSYTLYSAWCDAYHLGSAGILAVNRALWYANGQGVSQVQAAGNDGTDINILNNAGCYDPLAYHPAVVHVGALDASGHPAWFSNYGSGRITVVAPGTDIYSLWPGKGYAYLDGTSQAAPQVTGTLALIASRHPGASPAYLRSILTSTATKWGTSARYGAGRVNVYAAVRK